jgi:hypothetical protein
VGGAYVVTEVVEVRWVHRVAGHHHGHHGLPPLGVGAAGDRGIGDAGVLAQTGGDRGSGDVLAPADHHVVGPAEHLEPAVHHAAEVPRGEPPIGVHRGSVLAADAVAGREHRPTEPDRPAAWPAA